MAKLEKKERIVRFFTPPGFPAEFQKFAAQDPSIKDTMAEFKKRKSQIPPQPLPGGMRDHKLDGPLADYKECHLAGDILLIYTHANDVVTLCAVCTHADIDGKKTTKMAKVIRSRLT